jgi:uncharacterized protein Yka (UPF0111/DUF47 family)
MNYLIANILICILTIAIFWKVILPLNNKKVLSTVRKAILSYHSEEVAPLQQMLESYPELINEIHSDLEKLEDDIDLLSSEGQVKVPAIRAVQEVQNIYDSIERINNPK